MRHISRTTQQGFTLIEAVVTMMLMATLIALAAPQLQDFTANQAMRTASFNLTSALLMARSEAVKRNSQVTITPAGGQWSNGWTTVDSGGAALGNGSPFKSNVTVDNAPAPPDSITFNNTGRVVAVGVLQLQLSRQLRSNIIYRCITLDPSGLPRTTTEAC